MLGRQFFGLVSVIALVMAAVSMVSADLKEIKERGVIRHLGVPYARFVTGDGDGLDVAIIQQYAKHIGINYQYVKASWDSVIGDLSGQKVVPKGDEVEISGKAEIKGDIIGNGLTVLPWREKIINFSTPYIPTAVWVLSRADSDLVPIRASGNVQEDVAASKALLKGKKVLGVPNTCVDPALYGLPDTTPVYLKGGGLNDLAPAVVKGDCELTILDVPDCLVALMTYPGQIKVLGTITDGQEMAFGMSKDSPDLLASFNGFLKKLSDEGKLSELILRYYPNMKDYFPNLFKKD
jgi:ABC-type amino acid transport substrate-binding protein